MTLTPFAAAALINLYVTSAPLHVEAGHFKDVHGRTVVLRGVNTAGGAKVPPFMPLTDAGMLDPLPAWGINTIRLLFTWEAFEPRRGHYDDNYLEYIRRVVRWAHERGIYTVIDFHQDAISRTLVHGCGEGFPAWVLPAHVRQHTPDNGPRCARWFLKMWLDNDLWRTWRALFANEGGLLDAYAGMARTAAAALATEPGIIGYDLINEPVGNESTELASFYERVGDALRQAHPDAILFLEPHVRTDVGIQSDLPRPSYRNIVYAPHFYDKWTTAFNAYLGSSLRQAFGSMQAKAASLDAPLFVGEFGTSPETRNALAYMRTVYDRLDDTFASGAQWSHSPNWTPETKDGWNTEDLSIVDAQGALRHNFVPRPYAQKVAGTPVSQRVEMLPEAVRLELSYLASPSQGDTEIFWPPSAVASTPDVQVFGHGMRCRYDANTIRCKASEAGLKTVAATQAR